MNKSISIPQLIEKIKSQGPDFGGVFTFAQLCHLIGYANEDRNAKVILRLTKVKVLEKVKRGFYILPSPDLWVLASRLNTKAYISMDSVLARAGLIGPVPEKRVLAIHPGQRKQSFETSYGSVVIFSMAPHLYFGFKKNRQGILIADPEKAYLDLLYFHLKGKRFVIDPYQDVQVWKLKPKKIKAYLKAYKNPKFIQFVRDQLENP